MRLCRGRVGDENDRAFRAAMKDDDRGPLLMMFGYIIRVA